MKKIYLLAFSFIILSQTFSQGVALSVPASTPDASAMLDIKSTTKGFLPPRMSLQQRDQIASPVAGLTIYCNDCAPAGLYIYNGTAWSSQAERTFSIGEAAFGGKIFWVDETGKHGLVATLQDLQENGVAASLPWSNGTYSNTKAIRSGVYAGEYNSDVICDVQGSGNYAALNCIKSTDGGYGDWYLPSIAELSLLYLQRTVVGNLSNTYWSSTDEASSTEAPSMNAKSLNFSSNTIASTGKLVVLKVRAIRRF